MYINSHTRTHTHTHKHTHTNSHTRSPHSHSSHTINSPYNIFQAVQEHRTQSLQWRIICIISSVCMCVWVCAHVFCHFFIVYYPPPICGAALKAHTSTWRRAIRKWDVLVMSLFWFEITLIMNGPPMMCLPLYDAPIQGLSFWIRVFTPHWRRAAKRPVDSHRSTCWLNLNACAWYRLTVIYTSMIL